MLALPNQMSFLTISNEYFFENQGSRLGAVIAPNKGLEQVLKSQFLFLVFVILFLCLKQF